jgi:PAS domain S-box-containing protein
MEPIAFPAEQLAAVVEATTDFVGMADAEGRLLYLNPAARAMMGYAPEQDVSHLHIRDFHPPWAAVLIETVALPTAASAGTWRGETALLTRDGRESPVLQVVSAHRDKTGGLYYSTIVRDIADRVRTEAALRLSEQRYRTMMEAAPEAIVVMDMTLRRFVDCNTQAVELLGYSREQLLRLNPMAISPPTQSDGRSSDLNFEFVRKAIQGEQPVIEWDHMDANGRVFPCEVRLARIPDPERVLIRALMIDITERRRAAQTLRNLQAALEARVRDQTAELEALRRAP